MINPILWPDREKERARRREAIVSDGLHKAYRTVKERITELKHSISKVMTTVRKRGRVSEYDLKQLAELRRDIVVNRKNMMNLRHHLTRKWKFRHHVPGIPVTDSEVPEQIVREYIPEPVILEALNGICLQQSVLSQLASRIPDHLWKFANFNDISMLNDGSVLLMRSRLFPDFVILVRKEPRTMEYIHKVLDIEEGNCIDIVKVSV